MKFAIKAKNPGEFIGLRLNLAPLPFMETNHYALVARTVCEAVALGIFESIGQGERTIEQIATTTGLDPHALETVLNALVSAGYLRFEKGKISASRIGAKWLLKDSPTSICDVVLLLRDQWRLFEHFPTYLRTGKGFDLHQGLSDDGWRLYQRAMFQLARLAVKEIAPKTPIPKGATAMLDIGGSHGLFSVELCKRMPSMSSVVLDLPRAIEAAAPILAEINSEGRVKHQPGNILTDDIGENQYDLVFMASLAHHFSSEENKSIAKKAARALKKGGYFVIQDFIRPPMGNDSDVVASLQNLFFGLTSSVGVYSIEEEQSWHREAGLQPGMVNRFRSAPLDVQVVGQK